MDLSELVRSQLTADALQSLAVTVGEDPQRLGIAVLQGALPALLASVEHGHRGEPGAGRLIEFLDGAGRDAAAVRDARHTDAVLSIGRGLISPLVGSRADAVADLIAAHAGVRRSCATAALAFVAPLLLGAVAAQVRSGTLNTTSLASSLVESQRAAIATGPPGLAAALGIPVSPSVQERRQVLWPWLLVPAVALIMFFGLQRCEQASATAIQTTP
jgi:hypothetical protein